MVVPPADERLDEGVATGVKCVVLPLSAVNGVVAAAAADMSVSGSGLAILTVAMVAVSSDWSTFWSITVRGKGIPIRTSGSPSSDVSSMTGS